MVALSQLNRSVETRQTSAHDERPGESGAIEQDADVINMFIYRDEYHTTKEHCKEPGVSEIIISKQRNRPCRHRQKQLARAHQIR